MESITRDMLISKLSSEELKSELEFTLLYNDETKDQFKSGHCKVYLIKDDKVHNITKVKIASIKSNNKGFYYWNNGDLKFRPLCGYYILFEPISPVREEMESLLKRLELGDIVIKRKIINK